ncbi:MAG TPA: phosphotransferase [Roseiflexaceae bacterium]
MSAESYKEIIAACFPDLHIGTCTIVSQGWDSVAVAVDDQLIFRFPKRPDVEPQYRMEALLLPALAQTLSIRVPRFEFIWQGGGTYDHLFVGYQMIGGAQLTPALRAELPAAQLAAQLARFLAELHGFPADLAARLAVPGGDADAWRRCYADLYARVRAQVFSLLDSSAWSPIAARWEAFLGDDAHFRFVPGLVHQDLNGEHILVDPARGAVAGIIDWGDAAVGDPAIDFAGLLDDYGAGFTEWVLARYAGAVDATFRRRAAFYRQAMPLHTILFGIETGQPELVEHGLVRVVRSQNSNS